MEKCFCFYTSWFHSRDRQIYWCTDSISQYGLSHSNIVSVMYSINNVPKKSYSYYCILNLWRKKNYSRQNSSVCVWVCYRILVKNLISIEQQCHKTLNHYQYTVYQIIIIFFPNNSASVPKILHHLGPIAEEIMFPMWGQTSMNSHRGTKIRLHLCPFFSRQRYKLNWDGWQ